jgi:hypothetical protein
MQINDYLPEITVKEPRRHPILIALTLLVFAECALLVIAAVYLVVELLIDTPNSFAGALFLTVLVIIAAIWLAVIGVNTLRGAPWVRGAIVTWQIMQIAVAVGAFQGVFAQPPIGWALLIPSIVVLVLLFTKPVLAATTRRDEPEVGPEA